MQLYIKADGQAVALPHIRTDAERASGLYVRTWIWPALRMYGETLQRTNGCADIRNNGHTCKTAKLQMHSRTDRQPVAPADRQICKQTDNRMIVQISLWTDTQSSKKIK
jgi:hypothetical protein